MFVKKHYLNNKIWKRIRVPVVVVAFLCRLLYFHDGAQARFDDSTVVFEEAAVLFDAPITANEKLEDFQATAYSITGITKSGVPVRSGHVAADPRVIPLGSMIYVASPLMCGIYQVTDTGRLVKGKIIDVFIPNYRNCIEFGRRTVKVKVLRYGYEPDDDQEDSYDLEH